MTGMDVSYSLGQFGRQAGQAYFQTRPESYRRKSEAETLVRYAPEESMRRQSEMTFNLIGFASAWMERFDWDKDSRLNFDEYIPMHDELEDQAYPGLVDKLLSPVRGFFSRGLANASLLFVQFDRNGNQHLDLQELAAMVLFEDHPVGFLNPTIDDWCIRAEEEGYRLPETAPLKDGSASRLDGQITAGEKRIAVEQGYLHRPEMMGDVMSGIIRRYNLVNSAQGWKRLSSQAKADNN